MKKFVSSMMAVAFSAAAAVMLASAPASACDDHDKQAAKGEKATHVAAGKVAKVSLEGKVVTSGCPMEAAKADCTGVVLVVGETKHPIKKNDKGNELASKAKDSDKVVKVTGTQQGEYLTVTAFQIKS